ncbi:MAG: hypothetical protein V4513_08805 [Pseudomonadota bacterium]
MARKRHQKGNRKPANPFQERRTRILKALKDYRKREGFGPLHGEVIDVLMSESDRGAIILVAGVLEDVLAEYVIMQLPAGRARRVELLKPGGVLSSFQDKLALGRALGVIDDATLDSLDIIRQIRNECAHSMRVVSLKIPALNNAFGLLLSDRVAEHIREEAVTGDYLRVVLGLVLVFHVERIQGKTVEEAQAVVDGLSAKMMDRSRTG